MDIEVKNTIGKRIDQLLWHCKMNDKNFETACGLSSATVYKARNDNRLTTETARRIISKFPEVSLSWLLYGEGAMLRDKAHGEPSLIDAINRLSAAVDRLTETIQSNVEKN